MGLAVVDFAGGNPWQSNAKYYLQEQNAKGTPGMTSGHAGTREPSPLVLLGLSNPVFQDSHDAMRSLMWHKDQKPVCALVLAIGNEAQRA